MNQPTLRIFVVAIKHLPTGKIVWCEQAKDIDSYVMPVLPAENDLNYLDECLFEAEYKGTIQAKHLPRTNKFAPEYIERAIPLYDLMAFPENQ